MTFVWVIVHTGVLYGFLVVALATVGRRQMAQLTLIDYLIIALLGSAVETGLYLGGGSLWAGLVSAATLLVLNRGLRLFVARSSRVRRFLVGVPVLLVHDGRIVASQLRRARLTEQEVLAAVRLRGHDTLDAVRFAVMEPNGEISVVPREKGRA